MWVRYSIKPPQRVQNVSWNLVPSHIPLIFAYSMTRGSHWNSPWIYLKFENVFGWACSHLEIQFFSVHFFAFFSCNHFLTSNHCLCRGTAPLTDITNSSCMQQLMLSVFKGHMAHFLCRYFFLLYFSHIHILPDLFFPQRTHKHSPLHFNDITFNTFSVRFFFF